MFDQKEYLKDWKRKNMSTISAKFMKDFVNEFKEACEYLGESQAELIRKMMIETIDKAFESRRENNMYTIDSLQNEEKFNTFKEDLIKYDDFHKFVNNYSDFFNTNQFIEVFDDLNTSRDVYVDDGNSFTSSFSDKTIYDQYGDNAKVEAYAEVEVGYGKHVKLYGTAFFEEYNEEDEVFNLMSFGDYDRIELD